MRIDHISYDIMSNRHDIFTEYIDIFFFQVQEKQETCCIWQILEDHLLEKIWM